MTRVGAHVHVSQLRAMLETMDALAARLRGQGDSRGRLEEGLQSRRWGSLPVLLTRSMEWHLWFYSCRT